MKKGKQNAHISNKLIGLSKLDWVSHLVADPSQCNCTQRQNKLDSAKQIYFWTNGAFKKKSFQDLECPNPVKQSLFFDWLHYFLPFEPGRKVNAAEEEKGGMIL